MLSTRVVFNLRETANAVFIIVNSATRKVVSDVDLDHTRIVISLRQSHRRVSIFGSPIVARRIDRVALSTVLLQLTFESF